MTTYKENMIEQVAFHQMEEFSSNTKGTVNSPVIVFDKERK